MIDKESILKYFTANDDKEKAIKVLDKINLSYLRDIPICTNEFYTPIIWSYFESANLGNVNIESVGVLEEAERRIISINNIYGGSYPLVVLKIDNKSNFDQLNHKDYLGAILSLGLKREKIGDIVVNESSAYVVCLDEIADYIMYNLSQIGKSKVEISIIDDVTEMPKVKFMEQIINVSSLRIDSIVAKLANISRSKSIDIISAGKVLVNYALIRDKSMDITEGTRITIRGEGKFIVGSCLGETKSGKKKVLIKKYC